MVWCGWLHFVDLPWRQEGSPKMGSKILFQRDKSMFFIQQELHPKIFEDVGSQHLPIDGCHLFFESCWILKHFSGLQVMHVFFHLLFAMFFEGVLQLLRPNHAPKICPLRRPHVFPGDVGVMENMYIYIYISLICNRSYTP